MFRLNDHNELRNKYINKYVKLCYLKNWYLEYNGHVEIICKSQPLIFKEFYPQYLRYSDISPIKFKIKKFDCNWRFFIILEIELPKASEDKVYRLFLDPTGKHLIICMESTENLYLSRNSRKPRSIGKLKVKHRSKSKILCNTKQCQTLW